jgi:hypothetical protein
LFFCQFAYFGREGFLRQRQKGDAAVLADQDNVRGIVHEAIHCPLNDNELEANLPTLAELLYLRRGLSQPGGKLPLFDLDGQEVDVLVVRRCLDCGWAEPWFNNPLKPNWLVCKLTAMGRQMAAAS